MGAWVLINAGWYHWTVAMMAREVGINVSSVQPHWRAHGLRPHRVQQFKLSNDPMFVEKLRDVVGLYVDSPATRSSCHSTRRARSKRSTVASPAAGEEGAARHHARPPL